MKRFHVLVSICFINIFCLGSCNKYAEEVEGTYIGQLTINDSIVSGNADVQVSEVSNKIVSVESRFFDTHELKIKKQRYFSSVTYLYEDDLGTQFEIGETATGLFLNFVCLDSLNNRYFYLGETP